nr:MAG: hypothetical protein [Microvirus Sku121]
MHKENDLLYAEVGDELIDFDSGEKVVVVAKSFFDITVDYGSCFVIFPFDSDCDILFKKKGGVDKCLKS